MDVSYDRDDPLTMENDQTIVDSPSNDNGKFYPPAARDDVYRRTPATVVKADFSDIISATIRNRSKGIALCSALSLASSMALLSVSLAVSYTLHRLSDMKMAGDDRQLLHSMHNVTSIASTSSLSCISSIMTMTSSSELWAQLLTFQIDLLQNLVHASLLGAAAIVAAYRGDVVWLYFVRNCSFYFGMAAISFLVVDGLTAVELWNTTLESATTSSTLSSLLTPHKELIQLGLRLFLTLLFVLSAVTTYCCLDSIVRRVRKLQHQHFRTVITLPMSNSRTDCNSFPPYLAETTSDYQRASVIYYNTWIIQVISIFYRVWTTWEYLVPDRNTQALQCAHNTTMSMDSSQQHAPTQSLLAFEMSYTIGAHESFLLALMMLPGIFPRDAASVGGGILASSWRLVLAMGNIGHLIWHWKNDMRDWYSAVFTGLEAVSVIPILCCALLLTTNIQLSFFTRGPRREAAYSPLGVTEADDDDEDMDHPSGNNKPDPVIARPLQRIKVPSLLLISASDRYTKRQTWGAYILWASSCILLMGMAMEAIFLLKLNEIGSTRNNNVYKWGMHICAMYSFCTIMNVTSQEVYKRSRILLTIACPMGSLVALWQLSVLHLVYDAQKWVADSDTFLVVCLLSFRALSGIGQTIGLNLLCHIDPKRLESSRNGHHAANDNDEIAIRTSLASAQSLARFVLFWLYVPSTLVYGFFVALVGNCSQPMISLTTPSSSCNTSDMGFMLAQNWQGIGIAFHFGLLTVIFASDGVSTTPSYPPSVAIGSLFAGCLGLLIACDFGWAWYQESFPDLSSPWQWMRLSVLFVWMLSSCLLFVTLHRFWKLRLIPM